MPGRCPDAQGERGRDPRGSTGDSGRAGARQANCRATRRGAAVLQRRTPSTTGRTGSVAPAAGRSAAGRAGWAVRARGRSPAGHLTLLRRAAGSWPVHGLAQRLDQCPVERFAQTSRAGSARGRERAYDEATAVGEVVESGRRQVAQPAQDPISYDGGSNGPRHHKAHACGAFRARRRRPGIKVHSKQPGPAAAASPDGRSELGALAQPGRCRQHVAQAESRVRPLVRRAPRIERPARVRMRRRKPWVLARRRLFGWKVRLLTRRLLALVLRAYGASARWCCSDIVPRLAMNWLTAALRTPADAGDPSLEATLSPRQRSNRSLSRAQWTSWMQARSIEPSATRPSHGTGRWRGRSNRLPRARPSSFAGRAWMPCRDTPDPTKNVLRVVDNRLLPSPPGC
jgi:hypothetical protein